MNESDDMTFDRFAARFARIEALVPDAPTMTMAVLGRRRARSPLIRAAVLIGAVVLLAAAFAVAAIGSRPAPTKYVLSSYPNAEVTCEREAGPMPSVLIGDPCPAAISAVEASTATIQVPIVRVVIMPGPFGGCGDVWSLSTPASSCYPGYHVVPGTVMHAWVAFADTERILPVLLWRTLLPGTDIPEAWPSGGYGWNFTWAGPEPGGWQIPPTGWVLP